MTIGTFAFMYLADAFIQNALHSRYIFCCDHRLASRRRWRRSLRRIRVWSGPSWSSWGQGWTCLKWFCRRLSWSHVHFWTSCRITTIMPTCCPSEHLIINTTASRHTSLRRFSFHWVCWRRDQGIFVFQGCDGGEPVQQDEAGLALVSVRLLQETEGELGEVLVFRLRIMSQFTVARFPYMIFMHILRHHIKITGQKHTQYTTVHKFFNVFNEFS